MQALWLQQAYTDVILVAGSVGFSAHRFILAAASPAFQRLLMMDLSSELGARSSSESSMVSNFSNVVIWFKQEVLGTTVVNIFLQMVKLVC
jgi:Rho-related BTB domain-containing protein 1/2